MRIIYRDEYPLLMRQMEKTPEKLYLEGELPSDKDRFLCVVGSRAHSDYGRNVCRDIILGMRGYPVVIVSGLAIGIDSIAHEAALDAGLKTVAFPGSGLDESVLYPSSRLPLAKRILGSGGTLLSLWPPKMRSEPWMFPVRNELMAAISHAVLIIEGRKKSGTMITSDAALDLNRDQLAVPGSIYSDLSACPNELIRKGATAVTCSEDVLEALGFNIPIRQPADQKLPGIEMSLNELELRLIKSIGAPKKRDNLMRDLGITASELNVLLMDLELRGIISEIEGSIYSRLNR